MAHDTPMSPRRGRTRTSVAAGPSVSTTLHAHLVFVTKYRRGVLDHAMLTDCEHVMRQVCTDLRAEPRGLDGEPDHVHLLVRHPPTVSLPAGQLPQRGLPAPLRAEHAGRVERAGTRGQPWPPSYFAASCGGAPLEIVKEYIRGQQRPGKQRLPPRAEGRGSRPGSPMIRAARLVAHGRPPELVQARAPTRSTGEAVVAVTAAPITPLDVLCATGTSYFGAPALPYVPGVQGVGTIVEGSHLAAGTRVWFPSSAGMTAGDGSLAELAIASAAELVPLPDGVPDELVAGLGLSAVAAWMSLTWRARLQPGESVLVLGAGGVVGQVAVQAARILGASRVVAAARSADSRERAMSYAPDDVVELRPGDDVAGLAARLEQACGGQVSVVIDPLCGVPGSAAAEVLSDGGRLVNLGSSAGATAQYSSATLRSRSAAILGYTNNSLTNEQRSDALTSLLRHAARGSLTVDHETVEWGDLPDAWARQADGEARRRIVVRIS